MKKRKAYLTIAALLLLLAAIVSIVHVNNVQRIEREAEEYRIRNLLIKGRYATSMGFHYLLYPNEIRTYAGSVIWILNPAFTNTHDPFYTDLIFVYSQDDAYGFPDNIIVAWPGRDGFPEGMIAGIHWMVSKTEEELLSMMRLERLRRPLFTLEDFGLSYPLTLEDLVDNWEKVEELWDAFTDSEWSFIRTFASRYARDFIDNAYDPNP